MIKVDGWLKVGPINCHNEQYSLDANTGVVTLPGINTKGDCVHDQLGKYGVKFKSVMYNQNKDTFTIKAHAFIVDVKLVLGKETLEIEIDTDTPESDERAA